MTSDAALLAHRFIYVPWVHGQNTWVQGEALAERIATLSGLHPTVVVAARAAVGTRPYLARQNIVTERSGHVDAGALVIAWCPTRKVMQKAFAADARIVVVVEAPDRKFEAWARLVGAYNAFTGEVMDATLSEASQVALDGVVDEGYNGWQRDTDATLTLVYLRELKDAGGYDHDLVVQYAEMNDRFQSIARLEKLLARFEAAG